MTYTSRRKVSYFYDPEVGNFYYAQSHPMKPHRMRLTHNLLLAYGMLDKMDVLSTPRANHREMTRFHSDEYINFLSTITPESVDDHATALCRFNVLEDCPVFDGLWEYCQIAAGGSLAGASRLNAGESSVAINWAGGLHHAKKSEASGFCYINDCVLAILELLKLHSRVLYVDIDIHHGDGVEEAFYTTDRVMTASFHKFGDYFPGTGDVTDVGISRGRHYSANFPLRDGIDDESYREIFIPVMSRIMEWYQPGCVVLQCGADSLSGDRLGCFNLSLLGHAQCVDFFKRYDVPLLLLGGGGYTIRNVARCWAYETSRVVGTTLSDELPFNENYEFYGPEFRLHIVPSNMENHNSPTELQRLKEQIFETLRHLPHAPSTPMIDTPRHSPLALYRREEDATATVAATEDDFEPDTRKRVRRTRTVVDYPGSDDEDDDQFISSLRYAKRKCKPLNFGRRRFPSAVVRLQADEVKRGGAADGIKKAARDGKGDPVKIGYDSMADVNSASPGGNSDSGTQVRSDYSFRRIHEGGVKRDVEVKDAKEERLRNGKSRIRGESALSRDEMALEGADRRKAIDENGVGRMSSAVDNSATADGRDGVVRRKQLWTEGSKGGDKNHLAAARAGDAEDRTGKFRKMYVNGTDGRHSDRAEDDSGDARSFSKSGSDAEVEMVDANGHKSGAAALEESPNERAKSTNNGTDTHDRWVYRRGYLGTNGTAYSGTSKSMDGKSAAGMAKVLGSADHPGGGKSEVDRRARREDGVDAGAERGSDERHVRDRESVGRRRARPSTGAQEEQDRERAEGADGGNQKDERGAYQRMYGAGDDTRVGSAGRLTSAEDGGRGVGANGEERAEASVAAENERRGGESREPPGGLDAKGVDGGAADGGRGNSRRGGRPRSGEGRAGADAVVMDFSDESDDGRDSDGQRAAAGATNVEAPSGAKDGERDDGADKTRRERERRDEGGDRTER